MTDNGDGTYTLASPAGSGTVRLNQNGDGIVFPPPQSASVNLPITVDGVEIKNFIQVNTAGIYSGTISGSYGDVSVERGLKTGGFKITYPDPSNPSVSITVTGCSFVSEDDNTLQLSDSVSTYTIDKVNGTVTVQ